jgi:hypothetical protein
MAFKLSTTPWYENPTGRQVRRFWTPARLFELMGMMEEGYTDEQIGRRFGRSAQAVQLARKRYSIPGRSHLFMSARQVADALGIGCSKTVQRWIDLGMLPARKVPWQGKKGFMWGIRRSALESFLRNPRTRHLWDRDAITDPSLRAIADEDPGVRYLTLTEVAERYFVEPMTVLNWVRRGQLHAERADRWLVPEHALDGFIPPGQRSKAGCTNWFTPEEDAVIVQEHASGTRIMHIAQILGRTESSISNRIKRLRTVARNGAA